MSIPRVLSIVAAATLALGTSVNVRADQVFDLTTTGATSGLVDGATYTQVPPQSTGTGVIDSFVRIQSPLDAVSGYNTTVNNVFQNTSDDTHNHEITVGQVGFITLADGSVVMRFLLDINQTNADALLSLDNVQIYLSGTPNQSTTNVSSLGTLVYSLDTATADNRVELNYALNSGSGSGDMFLDISKSLFDTAFSSFFGGASSDAQKNQTYLYLYSSFGVPNNNNDGFEEWAHFNGNPYGENPCIPSAENNFCRPNETPEPGALPLVGIALLGLGITGMRKRRQG
jgi:hypothetical protein